LRSVLTRIARASSPAALQVDRQGGGDFATLVAFNPNDKLGLAQQRQRLPAFKARQDAPLTPSSPQP
jgi:hypothetical protein